MRLFLFLLFLSFSAFGQTKFLPGYYINRQGIRIDCLLAQTDFSSINEAGRRLKLRKDVSSPVETINASEINEVGIGRSLKFVRHQVRLEDSSLYDASLPVVGDPNWENTSVLLRTLVEGNASLFCFDSENGTKYFFSIRDKALPVTQLLYMRWRPSQSIFREKRDYQQQIFTYLNCLGHPASDYLKLDYEAEVLSAWFKNANAECNPDEPSIVYKNDTEDRFHVRFSLELGLRIMSLSASSGIEPYLSDSFLVVNPGIEAEMVTPSRRWALVVGLDFCKVDATPDRVITQSSNPDVYYETIPRVNMTALNIPIGLRYYAWNTDLSRLFLDASTVFCSPGGEVSRTESQYISGTLSTTQKFQYTLDNNFSFNFGIGYTFKQKWGVRFVFGTQKNYLSSYATGNIEALSNEMRFALRYTFF